ncbi:MAG: DNA-binding protein WhiA [Winkia neuii]|uniref:Probable cell division protein WhiA n=1 Tax=Winkia neuii TaxID=33007 RepID=A0A2I1IKN8_9ACTO|nr:DNA-binding protein WhiA [Winkia neuii]OFJ72760.1 DNA-binding protein WhiA [Actinomyces sp. HMSC064C12]OFK04884.1 DNA-binding protein WhiA [Actinomyces sp. HMSC072A03]OFT55189.1 DNA-binding protein WhiA [Actinomyces sp. HMSC06A08]KWZ72622.1 hypothetical protein HMPREF3198_01981 [Winkia neuii]MDK8099448.1 DNA-binding protein WhiA [Winkia neuii]
MSLTSDMKSELAKVVLDTPAEKHAELAAMLRFAGGLHLVSRRIVIEAEVDSEEVMERTTALLDELYNIDSQVIVVSGGGLRREGRYVIRVVAGAERLARLTGLIDRRGRPVRGLPAALVSGAKEQALAVWRAAFMARGSLTEPGRSSALEITCPGPEAGLALTGCARRLGITAKTREVRNVDRVVIRDGDHIQRIAKMMGSVTTVATWQERRQKREMRGSVNRLANFDDANLRRSARAAVASAARVEKAFEILGADIPPHLVQAGQLRVKYKGASLEELGQQADPPLTKDAVAGRIRRLLAMADKKAMELGIAGTESALTPEMLDG